MIEALLLTIELGLMMLLLLQIVRSAKPGAKRTLGLFAYKENKTDAMQTKAKKNKGHHA